VKQALLLLLLLLPLLQMRVVVVTVEAGSSCPSRCLPVMVAAVQLMLVAM
jgi:hypothetical protein